MCNREGDMRQYTSSVNYICPMYCMSIQHCTLQHTHRGGEANPIIAAKFLIFRLLDAFLPLSYKTYLCY